MIITTSKPRRMAREPQRTAIEAAVEASPLSTTMAEQQGSSKTPAPSADPIKRQSKQDLVIALLKADKGVLLTDIVKATGWLPHTARAALTGFKKKGHKVTSTKVDKVTRYSIASE